MTKKLTGEEFGQALLKEVRANGATDSSLHGAKWMKALESVLCRALGIEDTSCLPAPEPPPTIHVIQPRVRPEFPQVRMKFDSSRNVVARQVVNSMDHFGQLVRTNPEIVCWAAAPIPEGEGAE